MRNGEHQCVIQFHKTFLHTTCIESVFSHRGPSAVRPEPPSIRTSPLAGVQATTRELVRGGADTHRCSRSSRSSSSSSNDSDSDDDTPAPKTATTNGDVVNNVDRNSDTHFQLRHIAVFALPVEWWWYLDWCLLGWVALLLLAALAPPPPQQQQQLLLQPVPRQSAARAPEAHFAGPPTAKRRRIRIRIRIRTTITKRIRIIRIITQIIRIRVRIEENKEYEEESK